MRLISIAALAIALMAPMSASAQRLGTILEVFGTASVVGGVTRVTAPWDDFDFGRGAERPGVSADGIMWSVGVGRQVIALGDRRFLLTVDLVVPPPPVNGLGRRRPVLEFGVGSHYVGFQPIGPIR